MDDCYRPSERAGEMERRPFDDFNESTSGDEFDLQREENEVEALRIKVQRKREEVEALRKELKRRNELMSLVRCFELIVNSLSTWNNSSNKTSFLRVSTNNRKQDLSILKIN